MNEVFYHNFSIFFPRKCKSKNVMMFFPFFKYLKEYLLLFSVTPVLFAWNKSVIEIHRTESGFLFFGEFYLSQKVLFLLFVKFLG